MNAKGSSGERESWRLCPIPQAAARRAQALSSVPALLVGPTLIRAGPCSAQPCQNGGVCSQLPAPDPQSPVAAGEPGYSCTCPAGVSGTNCQVSGRGGRGAGHCALSSAGLQGPDPSFSLFGVGDGSGLLARVDADPWPTSEASLLCLPWFTGRASSGLSGAPFQGLVATLALILLARP